jgi:hypothetical protein
VAETDWRSELQTFQRGVEADTRQTAAEARAASLEAVHTLGALGALGGLEGGLEGLGPGRARARAGGAPRGPGAAGEPAPGAADGLNAARVAESITQARARLAAAVARARNVASVKTGGWVCQSRSTRASCACPGLANAPNQHFPNGAA